MEENKKNTAKLSRSEEKKLAILSAARDEFLANGYEQTSMDTIANAAAVSKRTVYSHFQSKEKLFAGIMSDMCQCKHIHILQPTENHLEEIENEKHLLLDSEEPIETTLQELGRRFLTDVYLPEGTALMRILVGQAENFPEIGREFFEQGPNTMIAELTKYFEKTNEQNITDVASPAIAAESYLSALLGATHLKLLTEAAPPPSAEEIENQVKQVTHLFLKGACAQK